MPLQRVDIKYEWQVGTPKTEGAISEFLKTKNPKDVEGVNKKQYQSAIRLALEKIARADKVGEKLARLAASDEHDIDLVCYEGASGGFFYKETPGLEGIENSTIVWDPVGILKYWSFDRSGVEAPVVACMPSWVILAHELGHAWHSIYMESDFKQWLAEKPSEAELKAAKTAKFMAKLFPHRPDPRVERENIKDHESPILHAWSENTPGVKYLPRYMYYDFWKGDNTGPIELKFSAAKDVCLNEKYTTDDVKQIQDRLGFREKWMEKYA